MLIEEKLTKVLALLNRIEAQLVQIQSAKPAESKSTMALTELDRESAQQVTTAIREWIGDVLDKIGSGEAMDLTAGNSAQSKIFMASS